MIRIAIACTAVLIVAVAMVVGLGNAQLTQLVGPDREAILYDGDLQLDSGGIKVLSWGSGTAEPVYEETYVGPQVLKVNSQGPYQGIVLQLSRPVDLEEFLSSGNAYLDLRVLPGQPSLEYRRQQEEILRQQARAGMGMRGGRGGGGMRGGRGGGGGMRGGRGGGGMRGGGGGMRGGGGGMRGGMRGGRAGTTPGRAPGAGPAPTDEKVFTVRNLRLVLFTDQGMMVADAVPVGAGAKDERGWFPVTAALSDMKGAEGAGQVRAVGIYSDESDVFYLGRVRLLADSKPVEVTIQAEPLFARPDQLIEFSVSLRGGPVNPEISWDFDKRDGVERQALGKDVSYLYAEPGDYLVTCTVTDKWGVRAPATGVVGIRVEGTSEPGEHAR